MTEPAESDARILAAQLGRVPRTPWRVAARCEAGFPTVIVSPSRLDDGALFPNYAWLTCPWLVRACSAAESEGAAAVWAQRARGDVGLAARLREVDAAVRQARAAEGAGDDPLSDVGLAGQADALGVKCLHAHVALALVGIDDPIGGEMLSGTGTMCPDVFCRRLSGVGVPDAEKKDDAG